MRIFLCQVCYFVLVFSFVHLQGFATAQQMNDNSELRLVVSSGELDLRSNDMELYINAPLGMSLSHFRSDGSIYVHCLGYCKIEGGLKGKNSVSIQMLRGSVQLEGVPRAKIELGKGKVQVADVANLQVQLGKGKLEAFLPAASHNRIDMVVGDMDLYLEVGDWKSEFHAEHKDIQLISPAEETGEMGEIAAHLSQGRLLIRNTPFLVASRNASRDNQR